MATAADLLDSHYSQKQLARVLKKSERTLQLWRKRRCGPQVTTIGRDPLYSRDGVLRWLKGLERQMVRANARKRR